MVKYKKGKLKETLVYSYIKDMDYIIIKNRRKNNKGPMPEKILLTPKCFKLLSMQSRTKRSAEVRNYYFELEELVDKYKDYIIDGLNTKITKLLNNQKPKVHQKSGIIYIIHAADDQTLYKIGKSSDWKERVKSYNS